MDSLIDLFKTDFERNPVKLKDEFSAPGERVIDGIEIYCTSDGKYIYSGVEYSGIQSLKQALKQSLSKNKYKSISKLIPKVKRFKIDAGYKWLNRVDLYRDDAMKSLGIRIQKIIEKYCVSVPGWKVLVFASIRETDILLIKEESGIILYFECKLSPQLDTEKGPASLSKIDEITEELRNNFSSSQIVSGLFIPSLRNNEKVRNVAPAIMSGHKEYGDRIIYGLNGLFNLLGVPEINDREFIKLGQDCGSLIKTIQSEQDDE